MTRYITTVEAAEKWGVSNRQVQRLAAAGRIPDAKKFGVSWLIPSECEKPDDPRRTPPRQEPRKSPLPFGVPNFLLTSFYSEPGTADLLPGRLESQEAKALCMALVAYFRGQSDEAERIALNMQAGACSFEGQVGRALVLATCAVYSGDMRDWNRARALLMALRRKQPENKAIVITEAALGGVLYLREAPEWLEKGRFEAFPVSSYPSLFYLYAKWLLMEKRYGELLAAVGPMIVSVRATGALLSELYLHLIAGAACRIASEKSEAERHIESALDLSLPDGLYGVLAEYRRQLGKPLDDALKRRSPAALASVRDAYDRIAAGFTLLHNAVTGDVLTNELSLREYEIASLALHGESNAAIARRIGVSPGSVKVYFNAVYQKLGVSGREELGKYIL